MSMEWQPSLGAVCGGGRTLFRVWAPKPSRVALRIEDGSTRDVEMTRGEEGYWTAEVEGAGHGTRYGFLLDGEGPFPDPCSRAQPHGVHELSEVADAAAFRWTDEAWTPPLYRELVIYECHIGTFTEQGTFDLAIERLPYLVELGVNAIEVMPVAAFPGRWNWGYDGVALFAPVAAYGGPEAFRRFVDAAHNAGIAVVLDVVYNHFGPDGNYTSLFAEQYFDESEHTPWGAAINFSGEGSAQVRRFFVENVLHWVHEYHIDGFRFDATHAIIDRSSKHILAELAETLEANARTGQRPYLVAESHENDVRYLRAVDSGGFGFDGVWADDFHHAIRTAVARDREGYFANFAGTMEELAATARQGFLYEGQDEPATGHARGTPARDVPWGSFVYCLQNHDQVGNRAFGERLTATASHAEMRAATLFFLLLPQIPMLFQGQEYFASTPFQYFTDHNPELGALVTEGRRKEFAAFKAFADEALRTAIPDPQAEATFARSKLNFDEAEAGIGRLALEFHRALLALRRDDSVLAAYRRERRPIATQTWERAVVLQFEEGGGRRWIVLNLGEECAIEADGLKNAAVVMSSDESRFGGADWPVTIDGSVVRMPPHTAAFLSGQNGGNDRSRVTENRD